MSAGRRFAQIVAVHLILGVLGLRMFATSVDTPMSGVAANLALGIKGYAKNNAGRLPQDWNQLGDYLTLWKLEAWLAAPVQDRFILLSTAFDTNMWIQGGPPEPGTVVAISAGPVREDRRESIGRYVIWRRPGNDVRAMWLDEERATKMFDEAGQTIPKGLIIEQPPVKHIGEAGSFTAVQTPEGKAAGPSAPGAEHPKAGAEEAVEAGWFQSVAVLSILGALAAAAGYFFLKRKTGRGSGRHHGGE
jgi:hypothetical protein